MGVFTSESEHVSPVSAIILYKAIVLDASNVFPKALPNFIKSAEILDIKKNFTLGSPFKYLKQKTEVLDKDNLVCKYTMIEGDPLGDKFESTSYDVKFEATSDGGCLCKLTSNYKTIGDFSVKEEEVKEGRESTIGIYRVVESYLLGNPQVYA